MWKTIEEVPEQLKAHRGIDLTLAQINKWAQIYEALHMNAVNNPSTIAWSLWEMEFRPDDEGTAWVVKTDPIKY